MIIIRPSTRDHTYGHLIQLLCCGYEMKLAHPSKQIGLAIDRPADRPADRPHPILSSMFDHIIDPNDSDHAHAQSAQSHTHVYKPRYDYDSLYNYYQMKRYIAPSLRDHFMFKEYEHQIVRANGFDFINKRVKYTGTNPHIMMICKIFGANESQIHCYQVKYFHLVARTQAICEPVMPMFGRIGRADRVDHVDRVDRVGSGDTLLSGHIALHNLSRSRWQIGAPSRCPEMSAHLVASG